MKKFVAILLTLMLVLGVSAAFAANGEPTFTKNLKVVNEGTTAPETTFTFKYEFVSVDDGNGNALVGVTGPALDDSTVTLGGTTPLTGTVAIPDAVYPVVGVYHYNVIEQDTNVAGIENHSGKMSLKVSYYYDGEAKEYKKAYAFYANGTEKSDIVTNNYSAGKLNINKTVTGNLGDKTKYFEFKVTLTGEASKIYGASYEVTGGSNTSNPSTIKIGEETTFLLKDGETISIANLPYGVTYSVTETAADGYTTTTEGKTTDSINAAETTVTFTNTKNGTIDTGVTTESLPYVVLMGFVVLAGAALLLKRKAHNN